MRSRLVACKRAARSQLPQSVWISDSLLASTLHHFIITSRHAFSRNNSNVPGPLEARRRSARRRINNLTVYKNANVPDTQLPPYVSSSSGLNWLSQLWQRPDDPQWTYEAPTAIPDLNLPNLPPLPQWMLDESPSGRGTQEQLEPGHSILSELTTPEVLSQRVPSLDKFTDLRRAASKVLADSENLLNETSQHAYIQIRKKAQDLIEKLGNATIEFPFLERKVQSILSSTLTPKQVNCHDLRLVAYGSLWQWLQERAMTTHAEDINSRRRNYQKNQQLYRDFLDRISAQEPTHRSCQLLMTMIQNLTFYPDVLKRGHLIGKVTLHILHYVGGFGSHESDTARQFCLFKDLGNLPQDLKHAWIEQCNTYLEQHVRKHPQFWSRERMLNIPRQWLQVVRELAPTRQDLEYGSWKPLALTQDPVHVVDELSLLPYEQFVQLLTEVWIPNWESDNLAYRRPSFLARSHDQGEAPSSDLDDDSTFKTKLASLPSPDCDHDPALQPISNPSFLHLAPWVDLVRKTMKEPLKCSNCIGATLDLLLKQDRPQDFAFLASRLHHSPNFAPLIPKPIVERWINTYSTDYPSLSITLSKICSSPRSQIADLLIDLIRTPNINNRALDYIIWREISKDRNCWLQDMQLDPKKHRHARYMSPQLRKLLHAFAIAYAREGHFEASEKFQRIYRLYRHMKLRRVEIHPTVAKLLTLTGAIVPTLKGKAVSVSRLSFLVRIQRTVADLGIQEDLMLLSSLNKDARKLHAKKWADAVYGANWMKWVGWDGQTTADKDATKDISQSERSMHFSAN